MKNFSLFIARILMIVAVLSFIDYSLNKASEAQTSPQNCSGIKINTKIPGYDGVVSNEPPISISDSRSLISDDFLISEFPSPSYELAEDFPQDKIKVLKDFVAFCTLIETKKTAYEISAECNKYEYDLTSIVKARLVSDLPLRYENFLASVPMSLAFIFKYSNLYRSPTRIHFFVENILKPLVHDLRFADYRGYRLKSDDFVDIYRQYAKEYVAYYQQSRGTVGSPSPFPPIEIDLAYVHARTFGDILDGDLYKAYSNIAMHVNFNFRKLSRPYYSYSDEDRYRWFLFFQEELRCAGYTSFADEVLQTELDHYTEMIIWQLQERVFMAEKLRNDREYLNLSTFKTFLNEEYTALVKNSMWRNLLRKALDFLKADEVIITLPWVDRINIDWRQGIR